MACRPALIRGLSLSAAAFSSAQELPPFGEPPTLDPMVLRAPAEFGSAGIVPARTGTLRDLSRPLLGFGRWRHPDGAEDLRRRHRHAGAVGTGRWRLAERSLLPPRLVERLRSGPANIVRVDAGVAAADLGPDALAGGAISKTTDAADMLAEGGRFGSMPGGS